MARVRSKSLSQPTCLDASRKIRTPRELRSSERKSPTPAAPPVVVSQKHGQPTARYTRRAVVPEGGPIRNSQVEVSLPREKRRAAAARGAGSGRSNNGGGGTQAEKSLTRKTRRGATGGVRTGGINGGGGGDGGSSSSGGGMRVKHATVTGSEKREEGEPKEALIEFRLAKKGLVQVRDRLLFCVTLF